GLVALADGHDVPVAVDGTDVPGRRLWLGLERPEHDRSLHGEPARHERMGRARGTDSGSALGRSTRKFANSAIASGLQAHQTNGARARRPRPGSGRASIDIFYRDSFKICRYRFNRSSYSAINRLASGPKEPEAMDPNIWLAI